jgi:anti-sigma factor RsiW
MNDQINDKHVTELLNAYYDGELRGRKLDRVASHLEHCPECQQALAELDALSALLQSDPLPQISTTPEQFTAQVGLRLPRRTQAEAPRESVRGRLGKRWMLMPVGVMLMVWFIQAVAWVTNLLTGIEWLGINPNAVSWLVPAAPAPSSPLASTVIGALVPELSFNINLFLMVFLPLATAGFYLAWLAWWWINQEDSLGIEQTAGS